MLTQARGLVWLTWLMGAVVCAQTAKAPTGTVSGRLTAGDQPLPGVSVRLEVQRPFGVLDSVTAAKTDANGVYRLTGVAAGSYQVSPAAAGFVEPGTRYWRSVRSIVVGEGESVEGVDFRLVRGGVITGKVTDADDRPVVAQRTILQIFDERGRKQAFYPQVSYMLETDDRGVYRVFGLPAGRYLVSVGREQGSVTLGVPQGNYRRTYYPGVTDEARATEVGFG